MAIELLSRPAPVNQRRAVPPPPRPAPDDDWSGALGCSALRPRNSAEYRVLCAAWRKQPDDGRWTMDDKQ